MGTSVPGILRVLPLVVLLACTAPTPGGAPEAAAPPPPPPIAAPAAPACPTCPQCPAGMAYVAPVEGVVLGETDPAEIAACGCVGGVVAAAPYTVGGFCIDRHPFPGAGKPWPTAVPGGSVTHAEAEELRPRLLAFGRRYCSYAEVLLASAGPTNRRYPWGDAHEPRCEPDQRTPIEPIGGRPRCVTPDGIYDLGVRTAWVTLDRRTATTLTAALDQPVTAGRLVLSGAHGPSEEAFFARTNFGIHGHTGPYGVFADESPPGWEWIDDGLRFCAEPGPPGAASERRWADLVDAFGGDNAAFWAVPSRSPSSPAAPASPLRRVVAGWLHTCGLDAAGEIHCVGFDGDGVTRPPRGPFSALAVGRQHACALGTAGEAVCWGRDTYGQSSPPPGRFDQIAAGEFHTCAIGDAGVACWGLDSDGQTRAPAGRGFDGIVAGPRHSCGLGGGGERLCWGADHAPVEIPPRALAEPPTSLSAGPTHACAVTGTGAVICWGANDFGQAEAPPGTDWVQVSAGFTHSCALTSAGAAACWGGDGVGQATPITFD